MNTHKKQYYCWAKHQIVFEKVYCTLYLREYPGKKDAPYLLRSITLNFYDLCSYCASEIRSCTPARVLMVGALDDMYGVTRR